MGFYDEDLSNDDIVVGVEDLRDTGPKIIIIENMFTKVEVQNEDELYFEEV